MLMPPDKWQWKQCYIQHSEDSMPSNCYEQPTTTSNNADTYYALGWQSNWRWMSKKSKCLVYNIKQIKTIIRVTSAQRNLYKQSSIIKCSAKCLKTGNCRQLAKNAVNYTFPSAWNLKVCQHQSPIKAIKIARWLQLHVCVEPNYTYPCSNHCEQRMDIQQLQKTTDFNWLKNEKNETGYKFPWNVELEKKSQEPLPFCR